MIRYIILFAMILLLPTIGSAETYQNGYTTPGGWIYYNGCWYESSDPAYHYPYSREWLMTPGTTYYSCGRYYSTPSIGHWQYSKKAIVYVAPTTPTIPAYSPNWRADFAAIAKERDAVRGRVIEKGQDHAQYMEAATSLFGAQAFRMPELPPLLGNINLGSAYQVGTFGVQGQTQYGYNTYQAIQQNYGSLDRNALYLQKSQLVKGAQDLARSEGNDFNTNITLEGQAAARVAEIEARSAAAERLLRASEPQASSRIEVRSTVKTAASAADSRIPDNFITNTAVPLCGACHSGTEPKGKMNISSWDTFTQEQKDAVMSRIYSKDPKKRMPFADAEGNPGNPLSKEDKIKFAIH